MAIITLTSDWGLKDYYVAVVKGAILTEHPEANIVDISHLVPPFDIIQASFILKNVYRNFPKGTIHVIGVNTQLEENVSHIVIYVNGHYFIGADNGIFSLIFDEQADKIIELTTAETSGKFTFPTKDVFVKAACHIAKGGAIEDLGKPKKDFWERIMLRPTVDESAIRGNVIYVDSYENVITNISRQLFAEVGKGRSFTIFLKKLEYEINSINTSYSGVPEGEKLALFNTMELLEISMNQGKAASLLGLKQNDTIRIEFYD